MSTPTTRASIRRLKLTNFKAFQSFDLTFRGDAFLVGPNNAGKSTLIEAMRGAAAMLRHASLRRPDFTRQDHGNLVWAYKLTAQRSEIEAENLRHNFRTPEARLLLELSNDTVLTAVWPTAVSEDGEPTDEAPYFYVRVKGSRYQFRDQPGTWRDRHVDIGVVPTLSPVLRRETLRASDYLASSVRTRRVSQHLRNHLLQLSNEGLFDDFVDFALKHLPEVDQLEVAPVAGETGETEIDVYYRETGERVPKEICWAGDGLQIYIQILWFAWHYRDHPIVIFDEPDVFLHADLQRRVVRVFGELNAQVITATHSPEMLAEASDDAVLWIDKSRRRAINRPDPATLQDLSTQIGSGFNLRLASALRAKVVVFVEGKDMKVLRTLAATADCPNLAAEKDVATIALGGFTRWVGVEPFKWLIDVFLGASVAVAVLLDRDYKTDEEVAEVESALSAVGVFAHVWQRSELENFLVSASAIARLRSKLTIQDVEFDILAATDEIRPEFESHLMARAVRQRGSRDESTVISEARLHVIDHWDDIDWRLAAIPGKDLLAALNRRLQARGVAAVSTQQLAEALHAEEIPPEMVRQLREIEALL